MYVTRRDIGAMNALPSIQKSKLSGRKTVNLLGGDKFPMTIEYSVGLLNNYKVLKKQQQHDK